MDKSDKGLLLVAIITLVMVLVTLVYTEVHEGGERDVVVTPANHIRCPEDADMVVRYGVDPAGVIGFCLASDDIEQVLP